MVERQLVERAQQGDPEAFDRLTELVMDRLYSVAYRILRHPQGAEDATQQALASHPVAVLLSSFICAIFEGNPLPDAHTV